MTEEHRKAETVRLVVSQYAELQRYLRRMLRRPEDANDLTQDVYLRLLSINDISHVQDHLAYMKGIAAHAAADHLDSRYRCVDSKSVEDIAPELRDLASDAPNEDDRLHVTQQIERALAQLPRKQAEVLLLVAIQRFSHEEAAKKLGISVDMVHKYMTKARARLRAMSWEL